MSKVNMSIHRALSELKTYDDRIQRAMQATFVMHNKTSNDKYFRRFITITPITLYQGTARKKTFY